MSDELIIICILYLFGNRHKVIQNSDFKSHNISSYSCPLQKYVCVYMYIIIMHTLTYYSHRVYKHMCKCYIYRSRALVCVECLIVNVLFKTAPLLLLTYLWYGKIFKRKLFLITLYRVDFCVIMFNFLILMLLLIFIC